MEIFVTFGLPWREEIADTPILELLPTVGATEDPQGIYQVRVSGEDVEEERSPEALTFWSEDSLVRTTPRRIQDVEAWMETVERCGGNITASLLRVAPVGLSARTYLVSSRPEEAPISGSSSIPSWSSGMASPGGFWILDTSESPRDAVVCSLSRILEDDPGPEFSISPAASRGMLERSTRRGKNLPALLKEALESHSGRRPGSTAPTTPSDGSSPNTSTP